MNENSQEFLKLLLEKSRYGILACDNNYRITYINKRVYEIHGVSPDEDPNAWEEYSTVLEADGVTPTPLEQLPLVRALRGEQVHDAYHVLKYKNQSSVLIKYNAEALYDESGNQIGAICTSEDSEDLASTLARFKAIFAQSPLSIQILNREGKTLLVNQSFKRLWGIPDDFVNDYILKTYNILEDEILIKSGEIEFIRRAFKGETVHLQPFLYDPSTKGFPGRPRWAGGIIYPLFNTKGEVHEVVIIHRDMTDQRAAVEEKDKLFSQLEAILRQMPAGVMVADSLGKISIYNEQMMSLIGDPSQAFRIFQELLGKSLNGQLIPVQEIQLETQESPRIISASSGPIHNIEGKISAGVIIAREVTAEKRIIANQAFLARVKSLLVATIDYNRILNQIAETVIPYVADGCLIDVVEGENYKRLVTKHSDSEIEELMVEMIGKYPLKNGAPMPSMRAITTGKGELLREVDSSIIAERTYDEDHKKFVLKIGTRSHIALPLQAHGKTLGAINFIVTKQNRPLFDEIDYELCKNIARNVSLTMENARLYRDAKSAVQLRDDFISMASHELRTPITSMNLQIEVLKSIAEELQKKTDVALLNKFLDSSKGQLDRLTKLVDDMLDISRINIGKLTLYRTEIELKKIIQEVLERFEDQLTSQNIELKFFCEQNVICNVDSDRIDQVITNFMTNSIRYGKRKPIHIFLSETTDSAIIKIQDFGRGIQKQDQERIFNRFERSHTSEDVSGLGLGLYINKQIINEHGGTITVDSELGEGSTFTVKLPKV